MNLWCSDQLFVALYSWIVWPGHLKCLDLAHLRSSRIVPLGDLYLVDPQQIIVCFTPEMPQNVKFQLEGLGLNSWLLYNFSVAHQDSEVNVWRFFCRWVNAGAWILKVTLMIVLAFAELVASWKGSICAPIGPKIAWNMMFAATTTIPEGGRQIHTADGLSTLQRLTTYSHAWQTRLVHFLVLILKPKFVKKYERSWTMPCIMCIAPVQGHSSHSLKLLATPWSFQAPRGRSWKQTTKRAMGANTMLAVGILIFKIRNPITVCLTLTIHGS